VYVAAAAAVIIVIICKYGNIALIAKIALATLHCCIFLPVSDFYI